MAINPNSLANLNRKGRIEGSKNRTKFSDVITDDKVKALLEELYTIATTDPYAKNRIAAATYLLDREYGKVPTQVTVTNDSGTTVKDLLNNHTAQDTPDEDI